MSLLIPLLGAVGGALAGSFIATLCIRWPIGEQAMTGRSRCDSCGRTLRASELVPLLSFAVSRGKCRSCGARIDDLHLQVELAAALLGGTALLLAPGWNGAALAIFWLLLLLLAILDTRHYWLPDSLTLGTALAGLLIGGFATQVAVTDRLLGGVAAFLALASIALAYRRLRGIEGLGAGDPKLFGAIGLWTGWQALAPMLVIASVAGLAGALAMSMRRDERMPFGTLLALAAILWTGLAAAAGSHSF